ASGYNVTALAPTLKVVNDLKNDGFEEARTVLSLLHGLEHKKLSLGSRDVVVVDEAAMIGTSTFLELSYQIRQAGAKVIFVGDERQLPSIDRGGMFTYLSDKYSASVLETVRRQKRAWQRD